MKRANREALNQKAAEHQKNQDLSEERRIREALEKAQRDTDRGYGYPADR